MVKPQRRSLRGFNSPQRHREHKEVFLDTREKANRLSKQIIGAAIEVHEALGPRLLESAYQICHRRELELRGIDLQTEVALPCIQQGEQLDCGYRMDEVVGGLVVVELKVVNYPNNFRYSP